ncbi:hypothetical protein VTJ49DRAFT_6944 [Mycothermus thermophilus]|uniref:Uncharacterized protein n=1 Tax=Humicola insolens TaxID=85995 RepID=A0ABR3V0Q6_HUMIN
MLVVKGRTPTESELILIDQLVAFLRGCGVNLTPTPGGGYTVIKPSDKRDVSANVDVNALKKAYFVLADAATKTQPSFSNWLVLKQLKDVIVLYAPSTSLTIDSARHPKRQLVSGDDDCQPLDVMALRSALAVLLTAYPDPAETPLNIYLIQQVMVAALQVCGVTIPGWTDIVPAPTASVGPIVPQPTVSGGPLVPDPTVSGGPLVPQPTVSGGPIVPDPTVSGGPIVPDPTVSGGPIVPDPTVSGGPIVPDPTVSGGPIIPDPIETAAPTSEPVETAAPTSEPVETAVPTTSEPAGTTTCITPDPVETSTTTSEAVETSSSTLTPDPTVTGGPIIPDPTVSGGPLVPEPTVSGGPLVPEVPIPGGEIVPSTKMKRQSIVADPAALLEALKTLEEAYGSYGSGTIPTPVFLVMVNIVTLLQTQGVNVAGWPPILGEGTVTIGPST